ncbi:hypothetical protein ATO7_04755 [Oceanococcus atlanticus]|uniref:Uncharacterized protein n=1 Tax=Oceanococcus atlanticus TaxID=1317117 RepID=A0A1Y1SID2_9GAMM|nr:hypothetical protein [Oceanococcus atlanticus]ORE89160.1 hypothetical protein ATO7_04755 [Oceanococcus atlanticus]RZO85159.1 MAG: hypothetical protein EVA65_09175 [Oceanococcus sp.]
MSSEKDILQQLDSTINAIEEHRDWRSKQRAEEEAKLRAAWQQLLDAATQLRGKLKDNPKLRYFSIARDGSEIAISFRTNAASSNLMSFYRDHPEGMYNTTLAIWCREPGRDDRRFQSADDAIQLMVRHCAGNLAS